MDVDCFLERREGKALMPHRRRRNSGRKWDMNFSFQNRDMDGIRAPGWVLPGNAGCRKYCIWLSRVMIFIALLLGYRKRFTLICGHVESASPMSMPK